MNEQPLKRDWFFWFIAAFTIVQVGWGTVVMIDFVFNPLAADASSGSVLYRLLTGFIIVPILLTISVLVLRHSPNNGVGLFLLSWATVCIGTTLSLDSPLRPYNVFGGWVGLWCLPLFFPDGRAFPRRFEPLIRWLIVAMIISILLWTVSSRTFNSASPVPNPLFISALAGIYPVANTVEQIILLFIVIFIVPSLWLRYRGSNPVVRQQIKWLAWTFVVMLLLSIPVLVTGLHLRPWETLNEFERLIGFAWEQMLVLTPFIAVGNAILRHNLYDIDIIIRRTLTYSVLTAILAVVYFGGVIVVQQILRPLTQSSDLAIVLSTLAIAALFNPLRHRIQIIIDRRFFRRKYNAQKTLEAFSIATRDEVDLDKLQAALVGVVQNTMQPTKVSLWLRTAENSSLPDRSP